jgi:hypothetical protein
MILRTVETYLQLLEKSFVVFRLIFTSSYNLKNAILLFKVLKIL